MALLDAVSPSLRAVTADFKEKERKLVVRFFYHGEVTERLKILASCAITEIELNVPVSYERNLDYAVRLDFPEQIPVQGRLVYWRNESIFLDHKQKKIVELLSLSVSCSERVFLELQDALLGKVTPSLRSVGVTVLECEKRVCLYFVYDGEILENDFRLIKEVVKGISGFEIDLRIDRRDFPGEVDYQGQKIVFSRNEDFDEDPL